MLMECMEGCSCLSITERAKIFCMMISDPSWKVVDADVPTTRGRPKCTAFHFREDVEDGNKWRGNFGIYGSVTCPRDQLYS